MEVQESYLKIRINFSSKKRSNNLIFKEDPLYLWKKSIFSFLENWNNGNQSVLINFTSGTTGIPKKIFLNKKYMYEYAKKTVDFLNLKDKKIRGLLCLSPDSIAAKMFLIRAIIFQWDIYCIPPSSNPLKNIKEYFDIVSMVPMQVYYSLKNLGKIRILLIGGSPISIDLEKKLQNVSTICYATYGMTETLGHIALKKINGLYKTNYYQTLKNISISIDKRNCLGIFSPYCMNSFIQTNDIVHMISIYKFNWIGRYDNVINSGGIKIIPELVEKIISPFIPFYKRFFISSIPDKILGEKVILIIEGSPYSVKIPKSIFIGKTRFYKPKNIFFVQNFIENTLGKFKRKEIKNKLMENIINKN
ncbi:o-succinylbenzoate--CoA ligase [Blattabacterium sp. (Cryptocercus kyebangensis)]|uniref:AMP-binding protein n=1 Tax=Blattabacterium sp. (Cryptocercus kyebangensis) TaxID=298656 RepID=UPI000D7C9428|nr:AMP-binding protein [Blattabacterium sp. (Cryptocercus kyebangensis)]AWU43705.1 o-succinylbenzoate--CoA ligase [Blattabacterium sp. (Cryptocercus kyebangensis)]